MALNFCPAALVAAPVESVWELLDEPARYDEWWDARIVRVEPQGQASPGQRIDAKTAQFGLQWDLTIQVERVDPVKHQVQLLATLPLGTLNHATITATPLDATSCRLQFG